MTMHYMALVALDDPHTYIAGLNPALCTSILSRFLVFFYILQW